MSIQHNPFADQEWEGTKARIRPALEIKAARLRTPGLRQDINRTIGALLARADSPENFVPEAVYDARHDLAVLSGVNVFDRA